MEVLEIGEPQTTALTPRLKTKLLSCGLSFFVSGINDGSLGPLIPYVREAFALNTDMVAILYACTFAGWLCAAVTNTHLQQRLPLGSLMFLGAVLQLLAHTLRQWVPPFPLYVLTFFVASLGQAYQDTHANTFVAQVKLAHRWLGFIHAMYMAGCLVGPILATAIASSGPDSIWGLFYMVPLGLAVLNLGSVCHAFRESIIMRAAAEDQERASQRNAVSDIKKTLGNGSVWLLSLFFFCLLGTVTTASGWIVEYLVHARGGDVTYMGYVPAGFNGGSFLGRLLLAEPTYRLGERRMVFLYTVLCLGFQLVFWLVPNIIAAAIAVSLLGFFSGPLFATGISVASKLFVPHIRSSALAFVFVLGQAGGSMLPALTGILASRVDVKVLQPMLVGLLAATGISWLLIPKAKPMRPE
ncbi:putative MFS transporter [Aspergillus karnatakaensis]|uniref:putative MFS transporter n=1 Tax=Aspergillus karnatakaensis TaxID=1810916 RepID=UPI003CCCE873